ncbi:MAG: phosphatase PAP2 family protein [Weeksellaceae bacterium]|nr:phosphatase PAP2 family protein [Weeksellaceae bacterium]
MRLSPYIATSLIIINISLIILLLFDKTAIHLAMTPNSATPLDPIMAQLTHVGDGLVPVIVLAILSYFVPFRTWITGVAASIFTGILVQFFKKIVFPEYRRPAALIDNDLLHFVDGVKIHHMYSFPSGHTATVFGLFIFLAFVWRKHPWLQVLLALFSTLVAYTRIYLSQHFLEDTVFGALLGIIAFIVAYALLYKRINIDDKRTVFQLGKKAKL